MDITLKRCAFDMNKFNSMFPKGKTQRKHTSHSSHTHHEKHAQHSHTHQHKHAFMYDKVYTCAHCGRKDHLVKFYKNVKVRESTNPIGPKKIWIPKNAPNLIDVGCRPLPRHRGRWYLGGGYIEAQRINRHIASLSRSTYFGDCL